MKLVKRASLPTLMLVLRPPNRGLGARYRLCTIDGQVGSQDILDVKLMGVPPYGLTCFVRP